MRRCRVPPKQFMPRFGENFNNYFSETTKWIVILIFIYCSFFIVIFIFLEQFRDAVLNQSQSRYVVEKKKKACWTLRYLSLVFVS